MNVHITVFDLRNHQHLSALLHQKSHSLVLHCIMAPAVVFSSSLGAVAWSFQEEDTIRLTQAEVNLSSSKKNESSEMAWCRLLLHPPPPDVPDFVFGAALAA